MTTEQTEGTSIRVNRNKIDSLDVFEVTQDELDQLQSGSPISIILNFAIATGSFGVSSLISLVNLDTTSDREYLSFFCATIVSLLACVILFLLWVHMRGRRENIIKRIRDRSVTVEDVGNDPTSNQG